MTRRRRPHLVARLDQVHAALTDCRPAGTVVEVCDRLGVNRAYYGRVYQDLRTLEADGRAKSERRVGLVSWTAL